MPHGTVKRIELARGFGFIVDDAGLDWFFVRQDVRGGNLETLAVDERVTFTFGWSSTGPRATDIDSEIPRRAQ